MVFTYSEAGSAVTLRPRPVVDNHISWSTVDIVR